MEINVIVLGVHGGTKRDDEDNRFGFAMHDSAALLLRDAQVLSAIEEERLNRAVRLTRTRG